MLQPKRLKHRKVFRRHIAPVASRGNYISFGSFGLKTEESYWLKANQIEAARKSITRYLEKGGKLWIRVFPHVPQTAKSAEVGMGGGSGPIVGFSAPVEAGRILFEIDGVDEKVAREAFRLASSKLPVKTRFIKK
ncbi:MAG: 50S ribosomal protein L16 [Parcubacteria group bacterium]|nr:50S ribosomal protein L16 [Parcubacteria group bacterium]